MGAAPTPRASARGAPAARAGRDPRALPLEWMASPWDDVARPASWLLALGRAVRPDVVHLNGHAPAPLRLAGAGRGGRPLLRGVVVGGGARRAGCRPTCVARYRDAVARGLRAAATRSIGADARAMLEALRRVYGPLRRARVVPNGRDARPASGRPARKRAAGADAPAGCGTRRKNVGSARRVRAGACAWPVRGRRASAQRPDGGRRRATDVSTLLGRLDAGRAVRGLDRARGRSSRSRRATSRSACRCSRRRWPGCALVLADIPSLPRAVGRRRRSSCRPTMPTALAAALTG